MSTPIDFISHEDIRILQEIVIELHSVERTADIETTIQKLSTILPFEYYSLSLVELDQELNLTGYHQVSDFPEEWKARYIEKEYWCGQDIVHLERFNTIPDRVKGWEEIYHKHDLDNDQLSFIEEAKQFGLKNGLMYGFNSFRFREASLFSISGTKEDLEDSERSRGIMQFITPYLHNAMVNVKLSEQKPVLTEFQSKVLELAIKGMKTKEIAVELEKSERTIEDVLKRMKNALQARNKADTITKSIERGLVSLKS